MGGFEGLPGTVEGEQRGEGGGGGVGEYSRVDTRGGMRENERVYTQMHSAEKEKKTSNLGDGGK